MNQEVSRFAGCRSLVSMIAWISVCLVTAAWGPQWDPQARKLCAFFGLLGLTTAVGLDLVTKARRVLDQRAQKKVVRRRLQRIFPGSSEDRVPTGAEET